MIQGVSPSDRKSLVRAIAWRTPTIDVRRQAVARDRERLEAHWARSLTRRTTLLSLEPLSLFLRLLSGLGLRCLFSGNLASRLAVSAVAQTPVESDQRFPGFAALAILSHWAQAPNHHATFPS